MKQVGTAEERALAKRIALKVKSRLPQHVPTDDLLQAALIGLWDALRKMPADITPEHRLARLKMRIRGRVIDELRALDWFPRYARDSGAMLSMYHAAPLERSPDRAHTPEELAEQDSAVAMAIDSLDERMRRVIVDRVMGVGQEETGAALGVSQCRICQMYHLALVEMRRTLERPPTRRSPADHHGCAPSCSCSPSAAATRPSTTTCSKPARRGT